MEIETVVKQYNKILKYQVRHVEEFTDMKKQLTKED